MRKKSLDLRITNHAYVKIYLWVMILDFVKNFAS